MEASPPLHKRQLPSLMLETLELNDIWIEGSEFDEWVIRGSDPWTLTLLQMLITITTGNWKRFVGLNQRNYKLIKQIYYKFND
jgi:hypothetical protein